MRTLKIKKYVFRCITLSTPTEKNGCQHKNLTFLTHENPTTFLKLVFIYTGLNITQKLHFSKQEEQKGRSFVLKIMHQSVSFVNIPQADLQGIFLRLQTPWQKWLQKPRPMGPKIMCEKALKPHSRAKQEAKL